MAGMHKNSFELTGNVGREGGKFYGGSDSKKDMGMVSVAHNNGYRNEHGEWQNTRTDWLTVKAFGNLASVIADLQKGDRVLVTGKLSSNNWTDRNGRKHYDIDLIADSVQLITTVPQAEALAADNASDEAGEESEYYDGIEADDVPLTRTAPTSSSRRGRGTAASDVTNAPAGTQSRVGATSNTVRTGIRSRDGKPVPQPQPKRETQRRSAATSIARRSNTRRTA